MDQYTTQKTGVIPPDWNTSMPATPTPLPGYERDVAGRNTASHSPRALSAAQNIREQCQQLALSIFFREGVTINSLGFTSSIAGEGKSFLAVATARALAEGNSHPVTLLDCNWDRPHLHELFGCAPTPGLAEWIRGECSEAYIHRHVGSNLTLIPAGDGKHDAVKLLHYMQQSHFLEMLGRSEQQRQIQQRDVPDTPLRPQRLLVVDLPAIMSTTYAVLAASLLESLIFVVCAGVTPRTTLTEAHSRMRKLPVQGVVLNQIESHVPGWVRQML